jgi:phosphoribosylanthranilate isomerase
VKIKICGLFREEDIGFANEARPDYIGFVFAESRRRVSPGKAKKLRDRLGEGIVPVGVFVNAPPGEILALYRDGVIGMAQLHGNEDGAYVAALREAALLAGGGLGLIKAVSLGGGRGWTRRDLGLAAGEADFMLLDNGTGGTGSSFDWNLIDSNLIDSNLIDAVELDSAGSDSPGLDYTEPEERRSGSEGGGSFRLKPWFLAGGIGLHNIEAALALKPYGVDVSGGAETGGLKDRDKMLRLTEQVRQWKTKLGE